MPARILLPNSIVGIRTPDILSSVHSDALVATPKSICQCTKDSEEYDDNYPDRFLTASVWLMVQTIH
jgi:hypothetical protein